MTELDQAIEIVSDSHIVTSETHRPKELEGTSLPFDHAAGVPDHEKTKKAIGNPQTEVPSAESVACVKGSPRTTEQQKSFNPADDLSSIQEAPSQPKSGCHPASTGGASQGIGTPSGAKDAPTAVVHLHPACWSNSLGVTANDGRMLLNDGATQDPLSLVGSPANQAVIAVLRLVYANSSRTRAKGGKGGQSKIKSPTS